MKVRTVALLRVCSSDLVAMAPARTGLVVFHRGENVVVDGARFVQRIVLACGDFDREFGWDTCDRDQGIGLQILTSLSAAKRNRRQLGRGIQRNPDRKSV